MLLLSCRHDRYIVGCETCRVRQSRRRFIFGVAAVGVVLALPELPAPIAWKDKLWTTPPNAFAEAMRAEMAALIRDIQRMEEMALAVDGRGLVALVEGPRTRLGARARRRMKRQARLAPIQPRVLQARIRIAAA